MRFRQADGESKKKKELEMPKYTKSRDMMRSKHPATQPTLPSPRQMAIRQIPMWCSQTRKITTVYLSYQELHWDGTEEGSLIHPYMKQQWMLHLRKLQLCYSHIVALSSQSGVITNMYNARKHKYVTGTNNLPSLVNVFYLFSAWIQCM